MALTWYETFSDYVIVDENGNEAHCGDGVDMFFAENGESIEVGTDEFYAAMDALMEDPETRVAYFGMQTE